MGRGSRPPANDGPFVACLTCKAKVPLKTILRGNSDRVLVCPDCAVVSMAGR